MNNIQIFLFTTVAPILILCQSFILMGDECNGIDLMVVIFDIYTDIAQGNGSPYNSILLFLSETEVDEKITKLIDNIKEIDDVGFNPYCYLDKHEYREDIQLSDEQYFQNLSLDENEPESESESMEDEDYDTDDSQPMEE